MRFGAIVLLSLCIASLISLAGASKNVEAQQTSLDEEFKAASEQYGVPTELLKAIGYVNTRWEMPPPDASDYEAGGPEEGEPEARGNYGIIGLYSNPSKDTLGKASELTGLSEEELKTSRSANIQGGAAVLADIQGSQDATSLNDWYKTVAKYGDGAIYANQVYEILNQGASKEISTGEKVTLEPQPEAETQPIVMAQGSADYSRAGWFPAHSSNYTAASRGPAQIDKVIVHVTQGSWSSAINWFQNSSANVSAQYTVRSSDGYIGQSVHEKDIAWHAGNWEYNKRSIGIEHEGYVSQSSWFTDAMYRSSAKLTAYLCKKYNIPISRRNIIGHNEVPGATHTDPGQYWNWTKYMRLVKGYAGSSTGSTSYTQKVDNHYVRFSAPGSWNFSSWNKEHLGKNYRYAKPSRTGRSATYKFKIPKKSRYEVFTWYPSSSGYNNRTRYYIRVGNKWKKVIVNQRRNGGKWVSLGTYWMAKGDRVYARIAKQSAGNGFIIADAMMVKER